MPHAVQSSRPRVRRAFDDRRPEPRRRWAPFALLGGSVAVAGGLLAFVGGEPAVPPPAVEVHLIHDTTDSAAGPGSGPADRCATLQQLVDSVVEGRPAGAATLVVAATASRHEVSTILTRAELPARPRSLHYKTRSAAPPVPPPDVLQSCRDLATSPVSAIHGAVSSAVGDIQARRWQAPEWSGLVVVRGDGIETVEPHIVHDLFGGEVPPEPRTLIDNDGVWVLICDANARSAPPRWGKRPLPTLAEVQAAWRAAVTQPEHLLVLGTCPSDLSPYLALRGL